MPTTLFRAVSVLTIAAFALLTYAGPAHADADLAKAAGLLKRAESNLQNVQQNVANRDTPPKGSAGKLLNQRLKQAKDDLEPAGQLLANVPDATDGAPEAKQRLSTAVALYNQLNTFMNPGATTTEAAPRDSEVPLGYPHADNFKNAQFTFRNKVEAPTNALVKLHAELLPVADQLTIDHRVAAQAVANLAETRRQAGFVEDALATLPNNGQGVAAAKQQLADAREALDGSDAYFAPLNQKLAQLVNPANYPQFEADRRTLDDITSAYRQDWMFTSDREGAAQLFANRAAQEQTVRKIAGKYGRLMQQQTDQGVRLEAAGNNVIGALQAFDQEIANQTQNLPASIRTDLAEANRMANEATQNQQPAWFSGGIPQNMGFAEDKLTLLESIAPEAATAVREEFDATEQSLADKEKSLEQLIITENKPPADNFQGEDRDAAVATAVDAWKHQEADFEVLGACIPSQAWERQEKFFYDGEIDVSSTGNLTSSGTMTKQDRSRIQVQLLIAVTDDPKLAKIIPVNVYKDHQKGDTMIGTPMFAGDETLPPRFFLLRENIN